jgi:Flp pilus assembly pilin Flp
MSLALGTLSMESRASTSMLVVPARAERSASQQSLRTCARGAVAVEYAVVVAIAGLTLALTLVGLGPGMVQSWSASREVLYGPSP